MKNRILIYPLIILGFILIFTISCQKDSNNNITPAAGPTIQITTAAISTIGNYNASTGGDITNDGGSTITARGVCWTTKIDPTISDNKTSDGEGAGTFNSTIYNLTKNTKYYVRAYATNKNGTAYGSTLAYTALY
ncbi:MAG: hypothetical protein WCK82_09385 [Bacteroidota bacterium]